MPMNKHTWETEEYKRGQKQMRDNGLLFFVILFAVIVISLLLMKGALQHLFV